MAGSPDLPRGISAGAVPSPNIWNDPATYELENRAVDPAGVIEQTMTSIRPYSGAVLLDIGCGTGFHLPRFAATASQVIGIEPHPALAIGAQRRTRGLSNVEVRKGVAQALPVDPSSIDVVHARWTYFFGPGCEPGLIEVDRVLRRGGAAFIIDNDASTSTFGRWFRWAHPTYDPEAVDAFFARYGWTSHRRMIRWSFNNRADLEAVVGIEFAPDLAQRILAEHAGTDVDYAIVVRAKLT